MPSFAYRARDAGGKLLSGTLEAANRASVVDKLRSMGYFIVAVDETKQAAAGMNADLFDLFRRVTTRDLVIFNNQLATMIGSGLTLVTSLNVLTQQIENKKLRAVISAVRNDVESGNSFSAALEKHPAVFSQLFVSMINAGETGGALEEILKRLAIFAEQAEEIRSNVKTAMTYPALILTVAVGVVSFLVVGVFPKFESLFKSMNIPLPLPTRVMLALSYWMRTKWPLLVGGIVMGGVMLWRYSRTRAGRLNIDTLLLNIPVFGTIIKKAAIARFCRTLGTLITSGVPILQSLRIVESTVGNEAIAQVVTVIADNVNRGESMSEPLRQNRLFPPMVGHMVAVGEESGTLDTILNKIADFFDTEVTSIVKRLSSIIEPIMLVCIGIVVAVIALSLFLPMFNMVKVAQ